MEQLFKSKWNSSEGPILNSEDEYTENFLFWCRKTEEFTDRQWARAFRNLEKEVINKKRSGEESWPPSYAEFIVLATAEDGPYKFFRTTERITDQGQIERTKKANRAHMAALRKKLGI